ncbi:uncharacterized protein [Arachis hypogaea]|uniref:uncharacterized protein n=1 Tax=Arachis hypogaea TaxID=3818 RepID=UPI003B21252F
MNQPLCYKLKELKKHSQTPPQQLEESTPTLPPTPSKINPAPEDAVALMMMARTASYVPKTYPMPSFSLGLTDSSQEKATTQEGASTQDGGRAKTPETPKLLEQLGDLVQKITSGGVTTKEKSGGESFEKFETPARTNEDTSDMKEKCYLWTIRVKTYADELTNEFDKICTLQVQDRYTLSKLHLASLAAEMHIEAEIVSAMCFILNQQKIKRFQEEVYCFSPDIVVYFLWTIRVKTYADELTNEFDKVCTLQAQDRYTLSKLYLASLAAETHIEAEIVSAMCFILNQQKIKRFQEEVYCLPPDIVNMAIANHP